MTIKNTLIVTGVAIASAFIATFPPHLPKLPDTQEKVIFEENDQKSVQKWQKTGHFTPKVEENKQKTVASTLPWQEDTANVIRRVFFEEPEKAVAVFRAESGLRADAQGWNCTYYRGDGTSYSTACEPGDRHMAWSVDCGVTQLNVQGQICPPEYFNVEWNVQKAKEWKYNPNKLAGGTGWGPWYAERNQRHLQFLVQK